MSQSALSQPQSSADSNWFPEEATHLIRLHGTLVRRIAYHLQARLPDSVQIDDLIQAGMIALIEAHNRFDESLKTPFEKYAAIRIRGAMLDEVRRNDWLPRSVHQKTRQISETIQALESRLGRDISDREVAAELKISLEEYQERLLATSGRQMVCLDMLGNEAESHDSLVTEQADASKVLEQEQLRQLVASVVQGLPERERLIISLYYVDELNLREIGEVIGVTESRVCQLHNQTLIRLRSRLKQALGGDNL
ncbi:RNA polymerase sigma factor FliA [Ectothiorhodospiraceae bacterium BW-2]|nr:RNA polymerase sigma factor FliA [Ectothiorhodospiraceae bacterium BW-2]